MTEFAAEVNANVNKLNLDPIETFVNNENPVGTFVNNENPDTSGKLLGPENSNQLATMLEEENEINAPDFQDQETPAFDKGEALNGPDDIPPPDFEFGIDRSNRSGSSDNEVKAKVLPTFYNKFVSISASMLSSPSVHSEHSEGAIIVGEAA